MRQAIRMDRNLRSSNNYIWNVNAVLGKGATSSVYQGMNKHSGEVVAIKVFNLISQHRPYEIQRREYELLSKVNHENIVKLIAIEEESDSQHKILIMELCTGGSLFNILDDPINSFGLEESEFLLVLKHIAAGMKHLRDMNIIHRDLKPGNIMKFVAEDGQAIYKLTDFGAARELEEDQQFVSLYGTEEYLHPEIYAKAVLKKPAVKSFTAKVDLWSIGVTLFHLATGSLPFRPYGGRKNREMMHRITTEKQQGIISGIQHSDNGDIEWNSNLPKTCLLSLSLQYKITPLLAGLLEYNPKNMWTFDGFFKTVTHVLSHKAVHVFCINNICYYTFYLQQGEKISHLKTRLANKDSTQIPIISQLMIWNKQELSDDDSIAPTTRDEPIILLNKQATSIKAINLIIPNQFQFPEILNMDGEHDAQQSKACASIAYCISRSISKCLLYCNTINQVPQHVMSLINNNVKLLNEKRESCAHLIGSLRDQIEYTSETTSNLCKCLNRLDPNSPMKAKSEINEIRSSFYDKLEKIWKELSPKIVDITKKVENLSCRWRTEPNVHLAKVTASKARAESLCSCIKDSWLFIHKNKSRSLSGNETQLQHLEKLRIDTNCKKLQDILKESNLTINQLIERLDDWYNDAHVALVQSSCLMDELSRLMKNRDRLLEQLHNSIEIQHQQWQTLMNQLTLVSKGDNFGANMNRVKHSNEMSNFSDVHQAGLVDDRNSAFGIQSPIDKIGGLECSHSQIHLMEQIQMLVEVQRQVTESLSVNQDLFSEVVSHLNQKNT